MKNISRRNFLEKTATLTAASLISNPMIEMINQLAHNDVLFAQEAHAYYGSELPPGFQNKNCNDDVLQSVWADMTGLSNSMNYVRIYKALTFGYGLSYKQVKFVTPEIEPGYWIALVYYNAAYKNNGKTLNLKGGVMKGIVEKIKGTSMENWMNGVDGFFAVWSKHKNYYYEETKEDLAKTFVRACGYPESDYSKLIQRIETKTEDKYIKNLIKSCEKQNYNEKLLVSWSIVLLRRNDDKKDENKGYGIFINKKIETVLYNINIPDIRNFKHEEIPLGSAW